MRVWSAAVVALVAAGAGAAAIWFAVSQDAGGTPDRDDTSTLARGATIYAEACASCHGADLEGQANWRTQRPNGRLPAPPHDETGHTWHHPDRVLLEITKVGTAAYVGDGYESDMPGFADIYSDAELRDVLEWIKSQWPERARQVQANITAQDEANR